MDQNEFRSESEQSNEFGESPHFVRWFSIKSASVKYIHVNIQRLYSSNECLRMIRWSVIASFDLITSKGSEIPVKLAILGTSNWTGGPTLCFLGTIKEIRALLVGYTGRSIDVEIVRGSRFNVE